MSIVPARRMLAAAATTVVTAAVAVITATPAQALPAAHPGGGTLLVRSAPPLPGVPVQVDGTTVRTDSQGYARFPVRSFAALSDVVRVPETEVKPGLRVTLDRVIGRPSSGRPVIVGLDTFRQVQWRFIDRTGAEVAPSTLEQMRLRSGAGQVITLRGPQLSEPLWLQATRIVRGIGTVESKELYYSVDQVLLDGGDLVYKAQQKFFPLNSPNWDIHLTFLRLTVQLRDWLFGGGTGPQLRLTRPDGHVLTLRTDKSGQVTFPALPRGNYKVSVPGQALKVVHPIALSRDSVVEVRVVTKLDAGVLLVVLLLLAAAPLALGTWWRRRRRRNEPPDDDEPPRPDLRKRFVVAGLVTLAAVSLGSPASHAAVPKEASRAAYPTPVLAYYYIWFNPTSWNRAKSDYPLAGHYSSDDPAVMATHIREAKAAGINGFLVSWKDTPTLDRRLDELVKLADAAHFHLGLVYEGLDVNRNPLPVRQVDSDLRYFAEHYASHPSFHLFDKPIAIWTGTWRYSTKAIARVTSHVRSQLMVLGSAKQLDDYQRIHRYVDGNAYYWSSVSPTMNGYAEKLDAMGQLVHDSGGLWIAPAAPSFDARKIGGHIVVPRDGGRTLRAEWAVAAGSNPDAIGLISWNEFSENSYVEPSLRYGTTALKTVAELTGHEPTVIDDPDSSAYAPHRGGGMSGSTALIILGIVAALTVAALTRLRYVRQHRGLPRARSEAST